MRQAPKQKTTPVRRHGPRQNICRALAVLHPCRDTGRKLGLHVEVRQSDSEGELIGWLHEAADARTPVVLNAGALTHYSYALMDAAKMRTAPLVEVHISNVAARAATEPHRAISVLTAVANGIIAGFGFVSYQLGLQAIAELAAADTA